MTRRQAVWLSIAAALMAPANPAPAAQLDPARWTVTEPGTGKNVTKGVTDNTLETLTALPDGASLGIDLGRTCVLHRLVLTGRQVRLRVWPNEEEKHKKAPLGLVVVHVGDAADTKNPVAEFLVPYDAGNPVDEEIDLRFAPAAGRHVRIEFQTRVVWGKKHWPGWDLPTQPPPPPAGLALNVAELEVYGFSGAEAQARTDAVVLPKDAAAPLALAASDLSYYLGELTGRPHPVVAEEAAGPYPGTRYRIVDLKPLAPTYEEMVRNQKAGKLPEGVNVEKDGREVLFKAWPYRCVLWSVWEFLERQGVRWLYPDAHGDTVPAGKGVNLGILPLKFAPSAKTIYANWGTAVLQGASLQPGYLYPWRNRWNCSWNGYGPLGGQEIPAQAAASALSDDFKEGFDGYPHNLNAVIPDRILQKHPAWWGYSRNEGKRVPPGPNAPTFCLTNPEMIAWVADKMVAVDKARPPASRQPLGLRPGSGLYNLLPMDGCTYCECEKCLGLVDSTQLNQVPWVRLYDRSNAAHYYFVCEVAKRVQERAPDITVGTLAYADVFLPPPAGGTFADTIHTEVCLYGAPDLPMSSPRNAALKQVWEAWRAKCGRLSTYDYALLHIDYWQMAPHVPVPLVTATVDRAKFLQRLGALDGGCQATWESLPYNPWNFYAYPRIRWNVEQTADQLLQEFFTGYYREAAKPMLAYYRTLEEYQLRNDISLYYKGYCYGITPGSFPVSVLAEAQKQLAAARRLAKSWVVEQRVARAQEGLDWVIAKRGWKGVDLNDASAWPKVGPGRISVDLTKMKKPDLAPWGNYADWNKQAGGWEFLSHGRIETSLNFEKGGRYTVTVVARGTSHQNVAPEMQVFAGSTCRTVAVASGEDKEYGFTAELPAGVWDLSVAFYNEAREGKRNLTVKEVRVAPQP
jgi:hypothetical protein